LSIQANISLSIFNIGCVALIKLQYQSFTAMYDIVIFVAFQLVRNDFANIIQRI